MEKSRHGKTEHRRRRRAGRGLLMMALLSLCFLTLPVNADAAAAKLNKKKVTLTAGKSTTLTVKNTKKTVKWKSSKKAVVTVKKTGAKKAKLTAKKKGTAKITATVGKKRLTCKVTVKAKGNAATSTLATPKLTKIEATSSSIRVYWEKTSDAKQYEILRKTTGNWEVIGTMGKSFNNYNDKKVEQGITYTYTVRAVSGTKKSKYDTKGVSAKLEKSCYEEKFTGLRETQNWGEIFYEGVKIQDIKNASKVLRMQSPYKEFYEKYISDDTNDFEKLNAIYDYIMSQNLIYDSNSESDETGYQTVLESLKNKKVVCGNISRLSFLLGITSGLECYQQKGTNQIGNPHAWLVVKIQGCWYHVDFTGCSYSSDENKKIDGIWYATYSNSSEMIPFSNEITLYAPDDLIYDSDVGVYNSFGITVPDISSMIWSSKTIVVDFITKSYCYNDDSEKISFDVLE